jgi:hypothetical protein
MKRGLIIICYMLPILVTSQSHTKGTLSFNANFDGGVHGTVAEVYFQNTLVDQDTSAAATTLFRVDAQYNFLKWLSGGIFLRTGKYLEDPDNAEEAGNKVLDFSLGLRAYMVNKDKFSLYFGIYYGTSALEINRIYTSTPVQYKWKGNNLSSDIGFNWYFVRNIGLNFSLGYSGHNFDLKEYYINNAAQNLTDWKHTFDTKGGHINLGIAFHILGEK